MSGRLSQPARCDGTDPANQPHTQPVSPPFTFYSCTFERRKHPPEFLLEMQIQPWTPKALARGDLEVECREEPQARITMKRWGAMNCKPGGLEVQMNNRPVFSGSRTDISSRKTLCSLNLHADSWDNPTLSQGCLPCTDKGIKKNFWSRKHCKFMFAVLRQTFLWTRNMGNEPQPGWDSSSRGLSRHLFLTAKEAV